MIEEHVWCVVLRYGKVSFKDGVKRKSYMLDVYDKPQLHESRPVVTLRVNCHATDGD